MSSIFHYTSTSGAFGIIESSCLYATHFEFMNDTSEIKAAINLIKPKFIDALQKKHAAELKKEGINEKSKVAEMTAIKISMEDMLERMAEIIFNKTPVYITSFCRHEPGTELWDNGLLSQWRGYGAFGGCSLQFNEEKMRNILKNECRKYAIVNAQLSDVRYDNHENEISGMDISTFTDDVYDYFVSDFKNGEEKFEAQTSKIYDLLSEIAPLIKSSAFKCLSGNMVNDLSVLIVERLRVVVGGV